MAYFIIVINVSSMLVFSCMTLVATLYILHMLALSVDRREGTADHHRWCERPIYRNYVSCERPIYV